MSKYFLFGTGLSLEQARDLLADLTGLHLRGWYNDWYGDYYATLNENPEVQVIENAPDPEGEMPEDDFPEPTVLVYVSEPSPEIEKRLLAAGQLHLLRVREIRKG
jgi:hypothetical protein